MVPVRRFELRNNVTEKDLIRAGFRNDVFMEYLYKKFISIVIKVEWDEEDGRPYAGINVIDNSTHQIYSSFYNREYGSDLVRDEATKKYNEVMDRLVKKKIFVEVKKNGKNGTV